MYVSMFDTKTLEALAKLGVPEHSLTLCFMHKAVSLLSLIHSVRRLQVRQHVSTWLDLQHAMAARHTMPLAFSVTQFIVPFGINSYKGEICNKVTVVMLYYALIM